jgi:transposase-like protein
MPAVGGGVTDVMCDGVRVGLDRDLGVERRRRWPDAMKLSILAEVSTVGWSRADGARQHDVTRQHI